METCLKRFPLPSTQFATRTACRVVIGGSTRTASESPKISVDAIGWNTRVSPFGASSRGENGIGSET